MAGTEVWCVGGFVSVVLAGTGAREAEDELLPRTVSGFGSGVRGGTGERDEGGGRREVVEEPRGRLVGTGAGTMGGIGG